MVFFYIIKNFKLVLVWVIFILVIIASMKSEIISKISNIKIKIY